MSDDSFIREVNEELRQDQLKALWRRYGTMAIAAAALVILATAAYVGYEYWSTSRANQAGDAFARALELADEGNTDEALAALEELETSGYGSYPVLARLRAAATLADGGKAEEAVAKYDAVAGDNSVPSAIRDMARLRAALLLVDHGSYTDVATRVEPLTAEGNAMRHTARETLALAAWNEGDRENALALFGQIIDDPQAPAGARQRAEMMSELIAGSGEPG
ncbi:tetratricopeptide repeat protein [Chelativorans alearense]|uniref:tetratricopeptide repeat protein n=1 Tax=Chelativorans alearense TaxID=2681495 RepID=UPI0013D058DF|nr:tetratricopeptide repeat protein [Chelativorans alearense]